MKNTTKKLKMRNIIFNRICVSRQELLKSTGLSFRALDRYISELQENNLISKEIRSGKRGRSSYFYRSNSANIIFAGLSMFQSRYCLVVLDINSFVIYSNVLDFQSNISGQKLVQLGMDILDEIRIHFPDKNLAAIGFNFNTFNQPESRFSTFRELMLRAGERFRTEVKLFESSSLNLLRIYTILGLSGSIGMLIFGDKIRLHVVTNGEIRSDLDNFLKVFRHRQIDEKSKYVCPHCRKRGCIDVLLTYSSIIRRYQDLSGQEPILYENLQLLGESGEPAARKIIEENSILAARTFALLKKELPLDRMMISNLTKTGYDIFTDEYCKLTGEKDAPLNLCSMSLSDVILATAEMVRKEMLGL